MKMNIIEDEPKSLIIDFDEVDRSIIDLIKGKLINSKDVEFVTVAKEHPESSIVKLVIKSSKNPRSLLAKAIDDVEEDIKELSSQLPKK